MRTIRQPENRKTCFQAAFLHLGQPENGSGIKKGGLKIIRLIGLQG
nr:hypothetical protein [uncultured Kingella sp.]